VYTLALHEACYEQKVRIGSKALQLAKLTGHNITIPGGFVITSDALDRFITSNRLKLDEAGADIENRFIRADVPDEVHSEVVAAFERLQGEESRVAVAVRSSSAAEDLEEASFAGQYETILNVTDLPHLLESLKRCWASLFSARVKSYAFQKNINVAMNGLLMGVLVQQMVQADVSGVIFSTNPVTKNNEEIIINASYGLGEAIVSGLVTPDTYYIGKTDGSIRKELGLKEMKIVAAAKETVEMETTEEEQSRFCLSERHVEELAEVTKKIEAFFGMPVDIEFAVKDSRVYILQARPITA